MKKLGWSFLYDNLKLMHKFCTVYSKDVIGEMAFHQFENHLMPKEGHNFI